MVNFGECVSASFVAIETFDRHFKHWEVVDACDEMSLLHALPVP